MSDFLHRLLGDSPLRVAIKLLVISIMVGFLMKVFGWYPMDIVYAIRQFVQDVWHTGFAALGKFGDYLLLGATIVIPVFILLRILSYRRK